MQQRLATQKCDCCIYTGFIKYLFKWASSSDFSAWFTQVRKQKGRSLARSASNRALLAWGAHSIRQKSKCCMPPPPSPPPNIKAIWHSQWRRGIKSRVQLRSQLDKAAGSSITGL